jgi:hypothetical protein
MQTAQERVHGNFVILTEMIIIVEALKKVIKLNGVMNSIGFIIFSKI